MPHTSIELHKFTRFHVMPLLFRKTLINVYYSGDWRTWMHNSPLTCTVLEVTLKKPPWRQKRTVRRVQGRVRWGELRKPSSGHWSQLRAADMRGKTPRPGPCVSRGVEAGDDGWWQVFLQTWRVFHILWTSEFSFPFVILITSPLGLHLYRLKRSK